MIEYMKNPEVVAAVLAVALAVSECLALNSKIKANSIFQVVVGALKKFAAKKEGDKAKPVSVEEKKAD